MSYVPEPQVLVNKSTLVWRNAWWYVTETGISIERVKHYLTILSMYPTSPLQKRVGEDGHNEYSLNP